MAPIVIAQVPEDAPLLRAINPRTIPAIPNKMGRTNKDNMERANADRPIPLPPSLSSSCSRTSLLLKDNGAANSAEVSS